MTSIAICYRSGEIEIVSSELTLPEGVIAFATGPRERLEQIVSARSRHGYHAELYLVPGLPEAEDDDAVHALTAWLDWAFGAFPIKDGLRVVS